MVLAGTVAPDILVLNSTRRFYVRSAAESTINEALMCSAATRHLEHQPKLSADFYLVQLRVASWIACHFLAKQTIHEVTRSYAKKTAGRTRISPQRFELYLRLSSRFGHFLRLRGGRQLHLSGQRHQRCVAGRRVKNLTSEL